VNHILLACMKRAVFCVHESNHWANSEQSRILKWIYALDGCSLTRPSSHLLFRPSQLLTLLSVVSGSVKENAKCFAVTVLERKIEKQRNEATANK
jgi:hypothetical protein